MDIIIRNETPADYRAVEELTRESFWNVYKPGADEHYFVHMMRSHPDFIPELAFVLEKDGRSLETSCTPKHGLRMKSVNERRSFPLVPCALHPNTNAKNWEKF